MRKYGFWLGLLLAGLTQARAQVTVEVVQDQDQFLAGEALPVAVRIINRSGQTLRLGATPDWLAFAIQTSEGRLVQKNGEAPVAGEFTLESSQIATKHLNLAPYFSFDRPGRYQIFATIHIPSWGDDVTSQPKSFDIVEGAKLWEQDFGVPPAKGASNSIPEMRKYVLQQANYLRGQLRLYLSLLDASGRPMRVIMVGPVLSFSHPEPRLDTTNNLHLLYQNGPRLFSYTEYDADGELTRRQTFEYIDTRPRLSVSPEGQVMVVGGARRVMASDIPAPKRASLPDEGSVPAPLPAQAQNPVTAPAHGSPGQP